MQRHLARRARTRAGQAPSTIRRLRVEGKDDDGAQAPSWTNPSRTICTQAHGSGPGLQRGGGGGGGGGGADAKAVPSCRHIERDADTRCYHGTLPLGSRSSTCIA